MVCEKAYLRCAAVFLLFTAFAKIISAEGSARILDGMDPILHISNRHVLLAVGIIEISICFVILLNSRNKLNHLLLIWLGGNFLLYRLFLVLLDVPTPCACLGQLTELIGMDQRIASRVMGCSAVIIVLSSLYFWFKSERSSQDPVVYQGFN